MKDEWAGLKKLVVVHELQEAEKIRRREEAMINDRKRVSKTGNENN